MRYLNSWVLCVGGEHTETTCAEEDTDLEEALGPLRRRVYMLISQGRKLERKFCVVCDYDIMIRK